MAVAAASPEEITVPEAATEGVEAGGAAVGEGVAVVVRRATEG